nr:transcriptional regulator [Desulfurococcales archaeon]
PEGAREKSPVVLGLVRLGDVRVVAELTDVSPEEVDSVEEVEAVLRRVRSDREAGIIRYAIKFRPVLPGRR